MDWILVSYYTIGNISYEKYAEKLISSVNKVDGNIKMYILRMNSLGTWMKNTHYKPKFIRACLDKYRCGVVYTDIDSELMKYPTVFNNLDCDLAACMLDHSQFRRKDKPPEFLSGTLFFSNTIKARQILDSWIKSMSLLEDIWDQRALHKVVGDNFHHLPQEYCTIKGYMDSVQNPVFVHHQASREHRGGPNYK